MRAGIGRYRRGKGNYITDKRAIVTIQLTAARVSKVNFREKTGNSADISEGHSQTGMFEFEPSEVSQPLAQPEGVGTHPSKLPHFIGLLRVCTQVSSLPKIATLARICRKSPAQTAEIPVFVETIGGDWFDHHWTVGVAVNLRRFGPLDGGAACAAIVRQIDLANSMLPCLLLEDEQTRRKRTRYRLMDPSLT